jgi:hypothetical protein
MIDSFRTPPAALHLIGGKGGASADHARTPAVRLLGRPGEARTLDGPLEVHGRAPYSGSCRSPMTPV